MKLDWYSFDESYLLNIEYSIALCRLTLIIDAMKSIDHPDSRSIEHNEERYEKILLTFEGIQFYRGITSKNILRNPNDDLGSIDRLIISDSIFNNDGFNISKEHSYIILNMSFLDDADAKLASAASDISFMTLISDMVAIQIGFENFTIKRIANDVCVPCGSPLGDGRDPG